LSQAPEHRHEIANLERSPGELSFDARIGTDSRRIWFRTETPTLPAAEAALAACLMPAMGLGGSLWLDEPITPRVLRSQQEFQAVQRAWSMEWSLTDRSSSRDSTCDRRGPGQLRHLFQAPPRLRHGLRRK